MPTAKVYHVIKFGNPSAIFPQDFKCVAQVEQKSASPGEAFEKTNHIDHFWWENPEVTKVVKGAVRSTSVGDVVVIDDLLYLCCPVGWEVLPQKY